MKVLIALVLLVGVSWGVDTSAQQGDKKTDSARQYCDTSKQIAIANSHTTIDTTEKSPANQQKKSDCQNRCKGIFCLIWCWIGKNSDPIIAVTTTFLAIWAGWQLIQQRGAHRRELRAYVFMEKQSGRAILQKFDANERILRADIFFKNFGKTPAYNGIFIVDMVFGDPKNPKGLSIHKILATKMLHKGMEIIPPNGYVKSGAFLEISNKGLIDQLSGLFTGHSALYVFGTSIYKDTFNRWWRSDFRIKYEKRPDSKTISPFMCESGNGEYKYQWYKRLYMWHRVKTFPKTA